MRAFGGLKKWELITLGAAAAAAITLRVLQENGVISLPRTFVIIFLMVFAALFFLRRPAMLLVDFIGKKAVDKDKRSAALIDVFFALIAEGVLVYLLIFQ